MKNFFPPSDYDYRKTKSTILYWLKSRLDEDAYNWLLATGEKLADDPEDWQLYASFSAVPRHTGKNILVFTEEEMNHAQSLRKNWVPVEWSADQLARVYLVLNFAENGGDVFLEKIEKIFVTSDLGEAVALYKGLPLYPYPKKFTDRAAEGVRSNISTVFNAVAHYNPYPAEYLDEASWNQIVLKALFVESALYKIVGLDERANQTLAKILVDYAHERWSAGREVSPELWRPVGPYLDQQYSKDIKKVLAHPDKIQKQAAILTLLDSHYSQKDDLLNSYPDLTDEINKKKISWDDIGRQFNEDGKTH